MSTYRFVSKLRKGMSAAIALLSGILIALQLILPSVALASPTERGFTFGTSQALDRASVAVVRLVVSYAAVPPTGGCQTSLTGLGVLVGSWTASPGSPSLSNWVLTDGALLNPDGVSCVTSRVTEPLSTVQIMASTAYTNASAAATTPLFLATLQCQARSCNSETIMCQTPVCSSGGVLLPFQSADPQPFLDVAPTTAIAPAVGIKLRGSSALPLDAGHAQQFLTPTTTTTFVDSASNEAGMPIVNSSGQLVDLNIKALDTSGGLRTFVMNQLSPAPVQPANTNAVHDGWDQGITAYYADNIGAAQAEFHTAARPNAHFQAPAAFLNLPAFKAFARNSTPTPRNTSSGGASASEAETNLFGLAIPNSQLIWLVILGVLLLVVLLVLLSLIIIRRGAKRRRRAEIIRRAERKAEVDASRIAEQERADREQAQGVPQQAAPVTNNVVSPAQLPLSDLRCPNCRQPVSAHDNFCPNCRAVLSPSDSGLHRRAIVPPVAAPPLQVPSPGLVPAASIYDQPTNEMTSGQFKSGQEELEKTVPFTANELTTAPALHAQPVEHFIGRNMSLAVGTRSNAGIKRQHKPNEDSLFAAQGERTHNSQAQQFGLFVVADGMGGHANGQDASRLAIQTIVDKVLTRLSGDEQFTDDALVDLLVDGVKEANLAVHQRNLEDRADMGTTMTAALVVGAAAFVANVGDSRTYLYRKPDGLKKITNDHSVVASLVEAGLIKPDDIYTHPKRNQIYRSLGEKPMVDVDSFKVPLQPGDKLLLCSDGLWDMVRDPGIEQVLSAVPDPSQTGNALIKAALDGGGEDNVSVIVVHINEATQRTGMTGVQLLARPDAPQYPPL